MSKINGEKARYAAARKKKLRRRIAMRALQTAAKAEKAPKTGARS